MFFKYMTENVGLIFEKLIQHMQITLIAVLFAIIIGVPLGILVSKNKKVGSTILAIANIFQTVPSLALFGFIIPLPVIGGIGYRPAVIVLFLYALLPIIKNTYIGIESVDPSIKESARGMGMTAGQILYMVTLPLSFSVIMGGIRVATVINIGTATIASLIGAGGLGDFIFRGIAMSDTNIILAGAVPTTILALLVDYILGFIEKKAPVRGFVHIFMNKKSRGIFLGTISALLVIFIGVNTYMKNTAPETIIIGTKNFTESRLLGEMLSVYIKKNTDLNAEVRELGGTLPNFQAIRNGDIDIYTEYTGTGYITILKKEGNVPSPQEVYDTVKKEFNESYGISWMKPLGFNNTYTLAVKKETANQYNLETFSDLAPISEKFVFGPTPEFLERPDGYPGLSTVYNFNFNNIKALDPGLRYNAIAQNQVQVIDAFSTDGKLKELDLAILKDDKNYFPPYYAVPLVNNETLEKFPELESLLNKLENILNDEGMQRLNYEVDVEKQNIVDVVESFLRENNLVE